MKTASNRLRIVCLLLTICMLISVLPVAVFADEAITEQQVYEAMIALKSEYPEGRHWTNDNFYAWNGGIFYGGYGCAGFAFILSDAAFGDLPARKVTDFEYGDVRVGDILRVNNDSHSVVVLEKNRDVVVLAEGNYNSSIHWGRTLTKAQVLESDYILTRYPCRHEYTMERYAPTCQTYGYDCYTCSKCSYSYNENYVDMTEHNYGKWTIVCERDEQDRRVEKRICSECGEEIIRYTYLEPDHVHSYSATVVKPTCTKKGYTEHVCDCGDSYKDNYTKAKGHSYVNGVCSVCGKSDPNHVEPLKNPFVDVKRDSVYYDAVLWAYYHQPEQITSGFDATHFKPDNSCIRGQVVTFLWRAAGCPEPKGKCPFKDVSPSSPYYKAIIWAAEQHITTGISATSFEPNSPVTRAQFVTFLWRYAGQPVASTAKNPFKDVNSGSVFYKAILWAAENGVTNGYGNGRFCPTMTCTRWHVVLFMNRYVK